MNTAFLGIAPNAFAASMEGDAEGLPAIIPLSAPSARVAERQGLTILEPVRTQVVSGGIADLTEGDTLQVEINTATPTGSETVVVEAIVIDGQPAVVSEFELGLRALIEAGSLIPVIDPDGSVNLLPPPTFVEVQNTPPAIAPVNDETTVQPAPGNSIVDQPIGGCNSRTTPLTDPAGFPSTLTEHEAAPGEWEIVSLV